METEHKEKKKKKKKKQKQKQKQKQMDQSLRSELLCNVCAMCLTDPDDPSVF